MASLIPRIRTIGVRLREDEYAALEKFCAESGAHSMAEVARSAISTFIRDANRKNALASSANRSSFQMKDFQEKLEQLTAEIAALKHAKSPKVSGAAGGRDSAQRKTDSA